MQKQLDEFNTVAPVLSKDIRNKVEVFEKYKEKDKPVVYVLTTSKLIREEFDGAYQDIVEDKWHRVDYNTEKMIEENSEDYIKRIINEAVFSDYIVVLTTALRIAPSGIHAIIREIKKFDKKVFIFITHFNQLPKKQEIINRVINKVGKTFDLVEFDVFPSSRDGGDDLIKSYADNLENIRNDINENFERDRYNQLVKVIEYLEKDILEEVKDIRKDYINTKSEINEERKIMRMSIDSSRIQVNSFRAEFSELKETVRELLDDINWQQIKFNIVEREGELPEGNDFFDIIITELKKAVEESIAKVDVLNNNYIASKLDEVIEKIKGELKNNFKGISQVKSLDSQNLNLLNKKIENTEIFDPVKQKCTSFEDNFVIWIGDRAKKIILSNTDSFKLKLLNYFREKKPELNLDFENEDSSEDEDKDKDKDNTFGGIIGDNLSNKEKEDMIKNMKKKYSLIANDIFDKQLEKIITIIKDEVVEFAENKINEYQNTINHQLNDSFEDYTLQILNLYPEFLEEMEQRYEKVNEFFSRRIEKW